MTDLWEPVPFDSELIQKYDRPGPRYTSYPTAPQFSSDFGPAEYGRLLEKSTEGGRPLSLYVHIPFCKTLCFYCGCNVTIARSLERGTAYLPLLEREMAMAARLLRADERKVVQIHWGGGTPNFLRPEDLARLMEITRAHFCFADDCEIGVEVDPRTCTAEHLDTFAAAGVNRLSMGVQDLDIQVQEAVNRVQSAEETWAVLDGARERGMTSINIDLIYGLPHQTPEGFAASVQEGIRMSPDRFAVFNFAYLPSMLPHQKIIDQETLPSPQTKLTLLEQTIAALTAAGYIFIGMDHFAKPEDPLSQALRDRTLTRNFQGYSTWANTDLVAFGVSSISSVADGYAQNLKTVPEYQEAIEKGDFATFRGLEMTPEDLLRQEVIIRLMCHFRVPKPDIEARHGIDFDRHFSSELDALAPFVDDDLIELGTDRLEVTPRGRLLVRNLAMVFDEYFQARPSATYSRTV
jgi:oxygen-independent coproporphyrinogen-3 oxidase